MIIGTPATGISPFIPKTGTLFSAPLHGESPVYEEVYHLATDPEEAFNRINEAPEELLTRLRTACYRGLQTARGKEPPKVLRYTKESKLEAQLNGKK